MASSSLLKNRNHGMKVMTSTSTRQPWRASPPMLRGQKPWKGELVPENVPQGNLLGLEKQVSKKPGPMSFCEYVYIACLWLYVLIKMHLFSYFSQKKEAFGKSHLFPARWRYRTPQFHKRRSEILELISLTFNNPKRLFHQKRLVSKQSSPCFAHWHLINSAEVAASWRQKRPRKATMWSPRTSTNALVWQHKTQGAEMQQKWPTKPSRPRELWIRSQWCSSCFWPQNHPEIPNNFSSKSFVRVDGKKTST